ncbi:hypothetical protein JF546_02405 [Nitratireductor aquimarinus]|uniref:hypothetical protein n=1 Tax=Nitratireductor aquimarinus TaxID=889300 RepID=UPI001A8F36F1|nr:hypothetical protein [Nitratireductor aquimarinus]MBN8241860.1 hypothetical protein [Nitratireductor aquimarinus]MBY6130246.1 hypothetical protein [Nitratireductor aquimarinus]MCA1305125.1 hypothetical protein [Nitratireductor aquimarinus]
MVDRVILGKRGAQRGLFISKPGFDVSSASDDNLLFRTTAGFETLQIVQTARVYLTTGSPVTITVPNLGYYPKVIIQSDWGANSIVSVGSSSHIFHWVDYLSLTSIRLNVDKNNISDTNYSLYVVLREDIASA